MCNRIILAMDFFFPPTKYSWVPYNNAFFITLSTDLHTKRDLYEGGLFSPRNSSFPAATLITMKTLFPLVPSSLLLPPQVLFNSKTPALPLGRAQPGSQTHDVDPPARGHHISCYCLREQLHGYNWGSQSWRCWWSTGPSSSQLLAEQSPGKVPLCTWSHLN